MKIRSDWKKRGSLLILVLMLLMMTACSGRIVDNNDANSGEVIASTPAEEDAFEYEEVFSWWKEDAPSLNALTSYVEAVTEEGSQDYIPPADRIAVFDMDGTLMGELYPTYLEYYMLAWRILKDPSYTPDMETLAVGRTLRDCALDNSFPEDMAMRHALAAAKAYAGMTLNEFSDFVTEILLRDVDGFQGMTYGECFYLPMVEVVEYLQDNGFTCYVCSGSDRFICRAFIEGMLDIPYENIIGMDVELEATGQGDEDGLDYVYQVGDDVVRTDHLLIKNLKTNKVLQIAQEIGRQPVLSFGNSSGDVSMHNYTISNHVYKSAAFMLIADDDVRDYGNSEKGAELRKKWEDNGYNVISMANDWKTIYGENVKKTGTFHWMEELQEDREASESSTAGRIGIIGAMEEEVAALKEEMEEVKITEIAQMEFCEGRLGDMDVVIVQCGMGKVNAGICANTLINNFDCTRVINTGVAGSLDNQLDIGDIVVSVDAVQHDYTVEAIGFAKGEIPYTGRYAFPADEKMRKAALAAAEEVAPDIHAYEGRICSGDQFISETEQKQEIVKNFGGMCCEMEGAAIAQACYLNDTPFVIIRAISDKSDGSNSVEYETFKAEAAKNCAKIVRYLVDNL